MYALYSFGGCFVRRLVPGNQSHVYFLVGTKGDLTPATSSPLAVDAVQPAASRFEDETKAPGGDDDMYAGEEKEDEDEWAMALQRQGGGAGRNGSGQNWRREGMPPWQAARQRGLDEDVQAWTSQRDDVRAFMDRNNIAVHRRTSSKTGDGVVDVFRDIAGALMTAQVAR